MTKKQKYPVFTARLSQEVKDKLEAAKLKSEKNWDKFFKDLLEK